MADGGDGLKPFYYTATGAMYGALRLLTRWTVEGKEAVPPRGPLIVAANHLSFIDPPLLAASIPRRINFVAKRELVRNPVGGVFIRAYGVVAIARGKDYRESLARLLALLARDQAVGLFPEGTRSKGGLRRGRPGIAQLAVRSNAPILPVGIYGSERVRGFRSVCRVFTRPRITVSIGEPFTLPPLEGPIGRAQLDSLMDMIMGRIAAQLPPEYRGEYVLEAGERGPSP